MKTSDSKYVKNVFKYRKKGASLDDSVDKALAVEIVGEKVIKCAGVDSDKVIKFVNIARNYVALNHKLAELMHPSYGK